jgi:hypothetical protein
MTDVYFFMAITSGACYKTTTDVLIDFSGLIFTGAFRVLNDFYSLLQYKMEVLTAPFVNLALSCWTQ